MQDLRTLPVMWFDEVWNKGREEAIDELFAADGVSHGLGPVITGPAEFKVVFRKYRSAFPDLKFSVEHVIADGDWTAARYIARGTHQGDLDGIAATGRPVEVEGMTITRWRDGVIVESYNQLDTMGMLRQLGVG